MKKGEKVNVDHYSKRIAKEMGLPKKVIHKVLMHMTQQLCSKIARGEEVRIKGFGRIYFLKKRQPKTK